MISPSWSMENLELNMAKGFAYDASGWWGRDSWAWFPSPKSTILLPQDIVVLLAGASNSMIHEVTGFCASCVREVAGAMLPRGSTQTIVGAMSVADPCALPNKCTPSLISTRAHFLSPLKVIERSGRNENQAAKAHVSPGPMGLIWASAKAPLSTLILWFNKGEESLPCGFKAGFHFY